MSKSTHNSFHPPKKCSNCLNTEILIPKYKDFPRDKDGNVVCGRCVPHDKMVEKPKGIAAIL